jgi:uncharacterized cofD-like protein
MNPSGPRVVALGGGHGLAATLRAARLYAGELTAVVSVADDGGSSGRLREIAGIPAPGDLRRCLVALAADDSPWAAAFEYRFPEESGDLTGHALGNLIIAGLANVTGDFSTALTRAAELVGSVGRVLPATEIPVTLKAWVDGGEVVGQVAVSETTKPITRLSVLPPDAPIPAAAAAAIARADQVLIGPGSLYTSVLATAAVPAIRAALAARSKGRVYVCNLRPQAPETEGFGPADHLRAVLDHGVAVDVMLAEGDEGPAQLHGVPIRYAHLRAPDGDGHDPANLAAALAGLT